MLFFHITPLQKIWTIPLTSCIYSLFSSFSLLIPFFNHRLFHFFSPSLSLFSRLARPAVQAELLLLGQGHHRGRLGVSGGHGLLESTEEAAGGGQAGAGDGQAHGQDAGGGGETESQKVTGG